MVFCNDSQSLIKFADQAENINNITAQTMNSTKQVSNYTTLNKC